MTQRILDEYGNGQIYTYEVKQEVMGLQSHEAVKRIVDVYNLSITPEEYMRLTGSEANKCLMAKAKLLPGIFVEGLTSK